MTTLIGIFLLAVPLAFYAFYTITVRTLSRKKKPIYEPTTNFTPFISVVIPTYNEMKMIERRLQNFDELQYPKDRFEAIFVDGASTDGTPELIERSREEGRPYIRLVRQPSRQGYNSAIFEGVSEAKADIVAVGEVGGIWHQKALSLAVRGLAQPRIGVVTGRSVIYNPDESLATRLEAAYRLAHDSLRYAESAIDTTPDMKGELLLFRKEIGIRLKPGETLSDNTSFDMAISYKARTMGWRAVLDPEVVFYEYAPTIMRERMVVQIRRATTFAGAIWNYKSVILNRKLGYFGMLIAPSRLLMLVVFPWVLTVATFILAAELFSNPLIGLVMLGLVAAPLLLKKTRYVFLSFLLSQVVLVIATLRLLFRRHTQMIQTVSTARR